LTQFIFANRSERAEQQLWLAAIHVKSLIDGVVCACSNRWESSWISPELVDLQISDNALRLKTLKCRQLILNATVQKITTALHKTTGLWMAHQCCAKYWTWVLK